MSYKKLSYILTLSMILSVSASAFSAVEISLMNGRTVTADRCSDSGDNLLCEKMGGAFTIPKREIAGMKEVKKASPYPRQRISEPQEESSVPPGAEEQEGQAEPVSVPRPSAEEETVVVITGQNPEADKRLAQITKRKQELHKERERLITAQEKLVEEVNNKGLIKSQEEFDAANRRITELGERIKTFNEEVKALNEEEKTVLKSMAEQP
jgi:hypothetical protein